MFPYIRSSETYDSAAILRRREVSPLRFEPLTIADIPAIRPYLNAAPSRTCDFTIGGLLMWADYFNYTYAIYDGTLFVKGVTENDVTRTAFSLPSGKPALADIEREQVMRVLDYYDAYGFTGVVLKVPGRGIVAFSVGEVIGDTLYVHIEKMAHDVAGAGETVNKLFASCMLGTVPHLRYINREEAVGDPGLRNAKESYHPCMLLGKYNVMM